MKDLKAWGQLRFMGRDYDISHLWDDVYTIPVKITSGRPSYSPKRGYRINIEQTLADFFSRVYPQRVRAQLSKRDNEERKDGLDTTCDTIQIDQSDTYAHHADPYDTEISISFMRTIRIPEDQRDYPLPPGSDTFPFFDIQNFSSSLPPEIVAQGGIFLPMYRKHFFRSYILGDCNKSCLLRPAADIPVCRARGHVDAVRMSQIR